MSQISIIQVKINVCFTPEVHSKLVCWDVYSASSTILFWVALEFSMFEPKPLFYSPQMFSGLPMKVLGVLDGKGMCSLGNAREQPLNVRRGVYPVSLAIIIGLYSKFRHPMPLPLQMVFVLSDVDKFLLLLVEGSVPP